MTIREGRVFYLKAAGAILVIFSCSAFGYSRKSGLIRTASAASGNRKNGVLILGEITSKREALIPEALYGVAVKLQDPFSCFFRGGV